MKSKAPKNKNADFTKPERTISPTKLARNRKKMDALIARVLTEGIEPIVVPMGVEELPDAYS